MGNLAEGVAIDELAIKSASTGTPLNGKRSGNAPWLQPAQLDRCELEHFPELSFDPKKSCGEGKRLVGPPPVESYSLPVLLR